MGNESTREKSRSTQQRRVTAPVNARGRTSVPDTDYLETYSKLINMGFNENIALKAASKYPSNVNEAMNYIMNITKNKLPQQFECVEMMIIVGCKRNPEYCFNFELSVPYSLNNKYSLKQIIKDIMEYIHQQYNPIKFVAKQIDKNSFIGKELSDNDDDWRIWDDQYITDYLKDDISTKGLQIFVDIAIYEHRVSSMNITCYNTLRNNTDDDIDCCACSIYAEMKNDKKFTENNLKHLFEFNHFKNEYSDKDECKFGDECDTFKKLEDGGNDLNDRCHVKLYRHPPRTRNITSSQEINSFCLNNGWSENESLYQPTDDDKKYYQYNEKDGYLNALIKEVIDNKFKKDLFINGDDDEYDEKNDNYSLLQIVDYKLNCIRHKQMASPLNRGEMLSIILYCGCDANYDLCKSQRNRDYKKWKWLDYCLYSAIHKLSKREFGRYTIYTGLSGTKLKNKYVESGYFTTYVSTSWIKDVALSFVNDNGMLFQIDEGFREHAICCDVSWISKFPDECEILIARSIDAVYNNFECKVTDNINGIQTVLLSQYGAHNTVTSIISNMNGINMNIVHNDDKPINDNIEIEDNSAQNIENQMQRIRLKQQERDKKNEIIGLDDDDDVNDKILTLISSEDDNPREFEISRRAALMCNLIKSIIKTDSTTTRIPIKKVRGDILELIVIYLKHHNGKKPQEIAKPIRSVKMERIVADKWDADYINKMNKKTIFQVILGANYMDLPSLLHLGCAKIATLIKGKSPEEIKNILADDNDDKKQTENVEDK